MIIGPKYKICKRLGASVFEKCQTQKFQLAETRSPRRMKRGGSEYGAQLLEKQKGRFMYGLSEGQFSRYVHEAMDKRGASSTGSLLCRLESRLDNVVFRSGFVKTRRSARQVVSHGHIIVNGRRMTIPSYCVTIGDVIGIRPESRTSPLFATRKEVAAGQTLPVWLTGEESGFEITVNTSPSVGETEASFDAAKTIQFYSR